jgi:hypothetical protein
MASEGMVKSSQATGRYYQIMAKIAREKLYIGTTVLVYT